MAYRMRPGTTRVDHFDVTTTAPAPTDTPPAPWREGLAVVGPVAGASVLVPSALVALGGRSWERPVDVAMSGVHALLALTATAAVLNAASRLDGRAKVAWRIFGAGTLVYAVVSSAWTVASVLGRADGGAWLPAFAAANLLLVGAGAALPASERRVKRTRRVDAAIMVVAATCLLWVLPVSNLIDRSAELGRHGNALALLGVLKVATVLVAVAVVARCRPDRHDESRPLALSLILLGVADLAFLSSSSVGYPVGSRLADALYNTSAALWVLVGLRLARPPVQGEPAPTRSYRLAPPEIVTPIALVTLAVNAQFDESTPAIAVALGGVLVLLAMVRLGMLEQEQRRLVDSLRVSARRLHDEARLDTLTGLGNRLALDERLQAIGNLRPDRRLPTALFFIDVDHFKRFNDGLGHHVGDRLLVEVARRLRDVLGDGVHRVGGDEFVAVVEGVEEPSAELLAQDVVTIARAPVLVDGQELGCTVSVGLAHLDTDELSAADPRDGRGVQVTQDPDRSGFADALLRRADLALYGAKERGRDQWSKYDPRLQHRADERLSLQQELHRVVDEGLIEVLYQPVVELRTGKVVAASASPRWRSARHGLLHPDSFLDALADGGLLAQYDALVFRQLARSARDLVAADRLRFLVIALSRGEIVHPGLVECVLGELRDAGATPSQLRIAVTEETVLDAVARSVLERLRRAGVQLVVHRFGTGPSSLLSLGDYPASMIAVDRSFVDGLGRRHDDTVIVNAVAGLTSDLGMELAADGITEQFQAEMLAEMGCTLGQGRLFGSPAPLGRDQLVDSGAHA